DGGVSRWPGQGRNPGFVSGRGSSLQCERHRDPIPTELVPYTILDDLPGVCAAIRPPSIRDESTARPGAREPWKNTPQKPAGVESKASSPKSVAIRNPWARRYPKL